MLTVRNLTVFKMNKAKLLKAFRTFGIAAVGGIIVALSNIYLNSRNTPTAHVTNPNQANVSRFANYSPSLNESLDFTGAAQKSVESVVHVKTQMKQAPYYTSVFDYMFGAPPIQPEPVVGIGSGVIISSDGYIVTNNHVIEKSDMIEIVLNDKHSYNAKLIGADPTTDLALLKINAKNLPYMTYGSSDDLKIGQWVLAVGNPFNLTSTVTAGIVSAKARNINILDKNMAIESFIQTDAAVNPGNSGGALVNTNGDLVGINTAIASKTGYFTGYSFAIPTSIVKKVVSDLMEYGMVQRAYIGCDFQDIEADLADQLKMDKIKGVYITSVEQTGASAEAGIKKGDVLTKIGEVELNKLTELQEQLSRFRPGDKIKVTVLRNGNEMQFDLTLRNSHGTTSIVKSDVVETLGAKFELPSQYEMRMLGINFGVKVTELRAGKLLKSGMKEGFIILTVNRQAVQSVQELRKVVDEAKGGVYMEGVYPNGLLAYYAFGMK